MGRKKVTNKRRFKITTYEVLGKYLGMHRITVGRKAQEFKLDLRDLTSILDFVERYRKAND